MAGHGMPLAQWRSPGVGQHMAEGRHCQHRLRVSRRVLRGGAPSGAGDEALEFGEPVEHNDQVCSGYGIF